MFCNFFIFILIILFIFFCFFYLFLKHFVFFSLLFYINRHLFLFDYSNFIEWDFDDISLIDILMDNLEYSEHPFLKEIGIEPANFGAYYNGKWQGSGPVLESINPST